MPFKLEGVGSQVPIADQGFEGCFAPEHVSFGQPTKLMLFLLVKARS
jgi:hypothetical protein